MMVPIRLSMMLVSDQCIRSQLMGGAALASVSDPLLHLVRERVHGVGEILRPEPLSASVEACTRCGRPLTFGTNVTLSSASEGGEDRLDDDGDQA